MKFALYGISGESKRVKFLGLIDGHSEQELWESMGVGGLTAYDMYHPEIPDLLISWRGMVGLASPDRQQMEGRSNHTIPLSKSEATIARIIGNGNLSEGIREALRKAH